MCRIKYIEKPLGEIPALLRPPAAIKYQNHNRGGENSHTGQKPMYGSLRRPIARYVIHIVLYLKRYKQSVRNAVADCCFLPTAPAAI